MSEETEIDWFTCSIQLGLDGYDTQQEHDAACREFIEEQLDMTASSVKIIDEPTIKVSELREWCEKVLEDVRFNKEQCDNYSDGWYACEHMAKEILNKFCGGV